MVQALVAASDAQGVALSDVRDDGGSTPLATCVRMGSTPDADAA